MSVERFMALANAHYYAGRDPLGTAGDFVTAPEVSQMFGELVGACLADLWARAGRPPAAFVELGPGRGTLAADALRTMRVAGLDPAVHFVETSPVLRAAQAEAVPAATFHDDITTLPADVALLVVANEFFDALPIRQFVATAFGWRERMVAADGDGFAAAVGGEPAEAHVPPHLRDAHPGSIVEVAPAAAALAEALAARIARQGGALLAIDYGYAGRAAGDTLQAVHAHAYADPFARAGEQDLTAHVDFSALARALAAGGGTVAGPVPQGEWLVTLGIAARAAALARRSPERGEEIAAAYRRLTDADEMGQLFKLIACTAPDWPTPAGFAR